MVRDPVFINDLCHIFQQIWIHHMLAGKVDGNTYNLASLIQPAPDVPAHMGEHIIIKLADIVCLFQRRYKFFRRHKHAVMTPAAQGFRPGQPAGLDIDTVQSVQATVDENGGQNGDRLGRIETLLTSFINNFQQNIYLDTGALVGATAGAYNAALGEISVRSNRR